MNRLKVTFVGAGNVAWHLAQAIEDQGHTIEHVYSRQLAHARAFAKQLFDCHATDSLDFVDAASDIFFLCVPDDAMGAVLDDLILPENAILVHTSGAKPLKPLLDYVHLLEDDSIKVAVFYPLMTLTKGHKVDYQSLPICIEASDEPTEDLLVKLGQSFSKIVYLVDSQERKVLHLAAVLSNNFVNHLLALAQDILQQHELDFDLLKPIIKETVQKAFATDDIYSIQTGPARRGDKQSIKTHLELLKGNVSAEKIYRVLSESIYNHYHLDNDDY